MRMKCENRKEIFFKNILFLLFLKLLHLFKVRNRNFSYVHLAQNKTKSLKIDYKLEF